MVIAKILPSFLSCCVSYVIFAEFAYGLPRDKRSPQWGLSSSFLNAGHDNRGLLGSVGGANLSPTRNNARPQQNNQQFPQILPNYQQISHNLAPISSNTVSAISTNKDEANQNVKNGPDSLTLLDAGVDKGSPYLTVIGQDLLPGHSSRRPQQNTVNSDQNNSQPAEIPSILPQYQQTGQNLKPVPSSEPSHEGAEISNDTPVSEDPGTQQPQVVKYNPEPADTTGADDEGPDVSHHSRFGEGLATQKPQVVNYNPAMFQVQPARPANEIV